VAALFRVSADFTADLVRLLRVLRALLDIPRLCSIDEEISSARLAVLALSPCARVCAVR
jgi:hypothetical protein